MITGELKNQVDRIWDSFWAGGITNPMSVIEQFTYLLFIRQLDEQQDKLDQLKSVGVPVDTETFNSEQQHLRWKNLLAEPDPQLLKTTVENEVFPFIKSLGGSGMAVHMRNATYGIDNPNTLRAVIDKIAVIELKKDILGDLYEYMLSKLSTSGTNGQFRTTQDVIRLMVELMQPKPQDKVIDPACGTAGFLVNAAEWMEQHHTQDLLKKPARRKFNEETFYGYDFDATMVRISAMNMYMHGFQEPNIAYRDSLGEIPAADKGSFDLILANPPFAGNVDESSLDKDLVRLAKTRKTELLFLNRFLSLLKVGGRAAVIVPEGVLFGSTGAHKAIRRELIDGQKLDAVIKLPSGAFKPYTGVSTAILCFTRTDSKATDHVWFYEVRADGRSLDDKRTPLLGEHLLGPTPLDHLPDPKDPLDRPERIELTAEQHEKNNLPDVVKRFALRDTEERERARTEQSFCVPVAEIVENDYDLSMNRYKEIVFEDVETRDPLEIIAEIKELDAEIAAGMARLEALLGGDAK
ncbi:SAM-dependent DNA methyltransferase [Corynebacterium hindlerae]|uniref:type I restriction-modification system subunit M n=1 Tax=Corynebacterium hindlerae TaxID=699041 RepID=UPI001AD6C7F3|nr:class I SAM-dependent DNA methyltransferase [Corynebacterium hindlerae]QTH59875.1 SAM-dependent DNA methyltransferase [Corynebacterium hindlerae]